MLELKIVSVSSVDRVVSYGALNSGAIFDNATLFNYLKRNFIEIHAMEKIEFEVFERKRPWVIKFIREKLTDFFLPLF